MDSTVSVSKGCFVFKNGTKPAKNRTKLKNILTSEILESKLTSQHWYKVFKSMWNSVEAQIKELHSLTYSKVLQDLVEFVSQSHSESCEASLPAATLLTGINQPDHGVQFASLASEIRYKVTPHVATLLSRDCPSVKAAMENMILQFISGNVETDSDDKLIKKSQCNLMVLKSWYDCLYSQSVKQSPTKKQKTKPIRKALVVVIPDFESFNAKILQDLILILSGEYPRLLFVLIFGVATALSAVHRALPYHVTSKMSAQVFHSQPSTECLNQVLDKIILSPEFSFHLSGKAFKFLIDVFLFYDFSVQGFIQGFKFCMMQHYFKGNHFALCCPRNEINKYISRLTSQDLEHIRHLPSFRPYVESKIDSQEKKDLILSDQYLKSVLPELMDDLHDYYTYFHLCLNLLLYLVHDLPKAPLGRQLREVYATAMSCNITETMQFKECVQMLNFLSKEEFIVKITKITTDIKKAIKQANKVPRSKKSAEFSQKYNVLKEYIEKMQKAGYDIIQTPMLQTECVDSKMDDRKQFMHNLQKMSKQQKPISKYELIRSDILNFLIEEIFKVYLLPLSNRKNANTVIPFYELFVFSDLSSVKSQIVGAPRAAIHTALNNPGYYLQCECCQVSNMDAIEATMPDICIAYKLHLECGRLINLFDWLTAFRSVIIGHTDVEDEELSAEIEPEIQARFTRCVAELQHLGFIKSSRRKRDHVTRLTW